MLKLHQVVEKTSLKEKGIKKKLYFEERESVCVREREREREKERKRERAGLIKFGGSMVGGVWW